MRYFIVSGLILITSFCYAEDKGWNVLYDENTGEIVEKSYGDSGYQHRLDEGYKHIKILSKDIEGGQIKLNHWEYKDGKVVKKKQIDIDALETAKKDKEKRAKIIDLTMKKDIAKKLGYTDEEAEYQAKIDKL